MVIISEADLKTFQRHPPDGVNFYFFHNAMSGLWKKVDLSCLSLTVYCMTFICNLLVNFLLYEQNFDFIKNY